MSKKYTIRFGKRTVRLGYNPRTGICSFCNRKVNTNLHHLFFGKNPLDFTVELCIYHHQLFHAMFSRKTGNFSKKTWESKFKKAQELREEVPKFLDFMINKIISYMNQLEKNNKR